MSKTVYKEFKREDYISKRKRILIKSGFTDLQAATLTYLLSGCDLNYLEKLIEEKNNENEKHKQ